jgi:beta-glucosidase-like glycosyl hydrolase
VGVDIVLAPVIDVAAGHLTLGSRVCSDDETVVEAKATQFISLMGAEKITPVLKHFPGIGQTTRDLHRQFDRLTVSPEETSLYPRLLDAFPQVGVMISHVGVENQYPDIPCSLSPDCVGQLKENYPQALLFSDALEMEAAGYDPNSEELKPLAIRSAEAIIAGNQILIYGPTVTSVEMSLILESLGQRYQADPTFAQIVDQRAEQVAIWKQLRL